MTPRPAPWFPSDDDLRMLTEHVFYEVQMDRYTGRERQRRRRS